MNSYENAKKGIDDLLLGVKGSIVCLLLAMIPAISAYVLIFIWLFSFLMFRGYFRFAKDIKYCKVAFIAIITATVVQMLAPGLFSSENVVLNFIKLLIESSFILAVAKECSNNNWTETASHGYTVAVAEIIMRFIGLLIITSVDVTDGLVWLVPYYGLSVAVMIIDYYFFKKVGVELGVVSEEVVQPVNHNEKQEVVIESTDYEIVEEKERNE